MMEQPERLFSTLQLLSDDKSFELTMERAVQNLWILNHLNDLEIKAHRIFYQRHGGYRQRKTTKYPIRRMRKKFLNTAELLEYLVQRRIHLHVFELWFRNGWELSVAMNWKMQFRTNSAAQRNALAVRLLELEGIRINRNSMNSLKLNYMYWVTLSGEPILIDDSHLPDEFWSEDEVQAWRDQQGGI